MPIEAVVGLLGIAFIFVYIYSKMPEDSPLRLFFLALTLFTPIIPNRETTFDFLHYNTLLFSPPQLTDKFNGEGQPDGFSAQFRQFTDICLP